MDGLFSFRQPGGIRGRGAQGAGAAPAALDDQDHAPAAGWTSAARRFGDALGRRVRYWQRRISGQQPAAAAAALAWLVRHGRGGGVAPSTGHVAPCPGLTAACLQTLCQYGQIDTARQWAAWLIGLQRTDGAFPDAGLLHASLFNTGRAIAGLMTLVDVVPEAAAAIERACGYIASRVDPRGTVCPAAGGGSFDRWAPPLVHLASVSPLAAAARRWEQPQWQRAVDRAVHRFRLEADTAIWNASIRLLAPGILALVELGEQDLARGALRLPEAIERRDGSVPAEATARWVSAPGLAQLAQIWFRLGQRGRGDRAMACLARRQRASGGFPGSWGRGAAYYPRSESAWAAVHFLAASLDQVRAAFAPDAYRATDAFGPFDGRLAAVRRWAAGLKVEPGRRLRIADVGCGDGRYLAELAAHLPHIAWTGIDLSTEPLSHLAREVAVTCGSLLGIPLADGHFDAVYAVEALEHALLPERAVDELCRVVRGGGSVMVIDKNAAYQPLSHHQPWEQWFRPEQVCRWLTRHCDEVSVEPIALDDGRTPQGLFLCWRGRRRGRAAAARWAA